MSEWGVTYISDGIAVDANWGTLRPQPKSAIILYLNNSNTDS